MELASFAGDPDHSSGEPGEEDFDALEASGFCRDDIYTRFLINQYYKKKGIKRRPRQSQSRRSRTGARHNLDLEALHHARSRMMGSTAPYFGALPVVVNEHVEFWIRYFKGRGRRDFLRWLVRGESLKALVYPVMKAHGIPLEFFYLAMVESGFNHSAYSRASATGTWQFMRATARRYGLKINHWVDERRDPVKSTIAAANLLKDLYGDLGDWYLAMAAYNAGPGKVRRAIRRSGSRDFWKIANTRYLARETRYYVPKVLAAILLASNPKAHGFEIKANPADAMPDTNVVLQRPVRIAELASQLNTPPTLLRRWNPELTREITPPVASGYALRLPRDLTSRFPEVERNLSYLEVTDVQMHQIRQGDTLSHLARKYKVKIRQILSLNPQLNPKRLRIGKFIAIPVPGVVTSTRKDPDAA